jgi:DNA polymerase-1
MPYKLILFDGSAFLFRSYFSTIRQGLTNKEGFPTGAIFGVIGALKKLEKMYPEAQIITVFDAKSKNFRHDIYPEYKANRKPADKALIIQIDPLYEIVKAMGFKFICFDGVEADDVIATISKKADENNIKTLIASGDKDLMSLVNANVSQSDMKGALYDRQGVIDKLGVAPEQINDFFALTGDSADNIPGVPSIGPKTAATLIKEYQTIANIKANMDKIKKSIAEKIQANLDLLDLSYKLVKLKFDVDLPDDVLIVKKTPDNEKLAKLYEKYEFLAWLKQLDIKPLSNQPKTPPTETENQAGKTIILDEEYKKTLIINKEKFNNLVVELKKSKSFVIDLAINSSHYLDSQIVGWAFLVNKKSFYIPVAHDYLDAKKQLNFDFVLDELKPILEDKNIEKIGENVKHCYHVLKNNNINLANIVDDVSLKSYCINSIINNNIQNLAAKYLNYKNIDLVEMLGKGKNQLSFNSLSINKTCDYFCEKVIIIYLLNQLLEQKIIKNKKLVDLYKNIEIPIIKVLVYMERNGIKVDINILKQQQKEVVKKMNEAQNKAFKFVDQEFNLESPKQVQEILFGKEGLGLKSNKKTPKGELSTGEEVLKSLNHPFANIILDYRALTKINSTYLEALPKQINAKTKRIHTSYSNAFTSTGRLSSLNPNLQNIPIREGVSKIRDAFVADKGNVIIAADYSQIELRIMAHFSKDKNLVYAFNNDKDVHNETAVTMFDLRPEEITKEHRRHAKEINFGLIYGMSAFGLSKQLDISRGQAKEYMDSYFKSYPCVLNYMDKTKEKAKELGYVKTIMGRRLYLPHIYAKSKIQQQQALRAAINAPMQGSSADIIKKAMIDINSWIKDKNHDIKMILQVHDELIFETKNSKAKAFAGKIEQLMRDVCKLDIPLKVNTKIGNSWQQAS